MKALAIDCAVSRIAIASKSDESTVKIVYDIGIRQSEKLLPAVDFVMGELGLTPSQLDYTCLTLGPGSFTGLRLGLSTLKALTLACGTPVYGIPSLEAYAFPCSKEESVISVIEAKEDEYFYQFFSKGSALTEIEDKAVSDIAGLLSQEQRTLVTGPAAQVFADGVRQVSPLILLEDFYAGCDCTGSLFALAEQRMASGAQPLQDYDGPLYARKSEAELVLEAKNTKA
ncbi:MAG: tRNA (adenosine(37)-N6)-threonylcarbamoyltransferase complex dimerization subunit type 1 TsaB [Treponema sp.]|nr:tRNA (adenosine(37)-N6)-threonylcarbamoyltransferase complex dimerization subunit type 1 TsaB [Treponema sp.]MBQ6565680.1 tRNA (adenosine(37)-N6)-threonylcarbamoyltransferase complex dimerization subunit type 1 TsaB [Treponema sp.]MBQ7165789.1 tRNA (adenosine(37)-N6)-threonylcarbamoyltransferase complex dimerization subunit type 1 TsaB [Treponema sp.]